MSLFSIFRFNRLNPETPYLSYQFIVSVIIIRNVVIVIIITIVFIFYYCYFYYLINTLFRLLYTPI